MKKRHLLVSLMTLVLCLTLISGATFALFTSESKVNIAVTSGKVAVKAEIDNLKTYYLDVLQDAGKFENGGTAVLSEQNSKLNLNLMTPGDKAVLNIKMENTSNVKIKYRIVLAISGELASGLKSKAKFDGNEYALDSGETDWFDLEALADIPDVEVEIELPLEAGNEYQEKTAEVIVTVEAIQWNTPLESKWDGVSASTEWYTSNPDATEYKLNDAAQVAGLADLVDAGETFEGKTIKLAIDMNLEAYDANDEAICFDPIGSYRNDVPFKGTFDGQGHAIINLTQNTWALNNGYYYGDLGLGFFGKVEDATIKNLTMDGASISGESAICGTVAGTAYGDCKFENITVKNANVADYQYYAGGIVGWASGNHEYVNCTIDASATIAAQWGDFDNSIGGVIGGAGGSATILIKDCTVACRIDAYNDVTSSYQWYAYRRAGMLIGNTGKTAVEGGTTYAAAPQLTCENVTVIYGEWANYTYCEFAGTSWPYVRVQAGVSNSAYSNPRYGHPVDANGNEVTDDNHVHNVGEDHHILCAFDQLYGGGQGVYGKSTHDGVTIIYNNK